MTTASDGEYVPTTGLAWLRTGEYVVSAKAARDFPFGEVAEKPDGDRDEQGEA